MVMTVQHSGSVLSRALRSRAIRPQVATAGAHSIALGNTSPIQRLYSSSNSVPLRNDSTEDDRDHDHETSPSQPGPSTRDGDNAGIMRGVKIPYKKQSHAMRKENGRTLMDIASATTTTGATFSSKSIALELQWLTDPKTLADRVGRLLKAGDVAQAAALTREAQRRQIRCDQAWNHLMRYCMDEGYPDAAFKFYNDMKKRGRQPSPKTYTIMLQGFSKGGKGPKSRETVKKAESIYKAIFAKNSSVKPNIIHSNAMLSVCQRHGDLDTLWRIAGDLPDEGPDMPDMRTYSIILAALHHAARDDLRKMKPHQVDEVIARQEKMVTEGKRIWADVIYRWSNDGLQLSNQVVNAMAHLLLDGVHDSDFYDVLQLYNQTMGVPILAKRPEPNMTISRSRARFILRSYEKARLTTGNEPEHEDVPFVDEDNKPLRRETENEETAPAEEEEDDMEEEDFEFLFQPVTLADGQSPEHLVPDSKDLTVILTACSNMTHNFSAGQSYWDLFTRESEKFHLQADEICCMEYLRLLRRARASKDTARVVREQMLPWGTTDATAFHVAFASCRRDRRNQSVLLNAKDLLDTMRKGLVLPDPRVIEGYLALIQEFSDDPQSILNLRGLKIDEGSKSQTLQALGKQLQAKLGLFALDTLRPHYLQLHEAFSEGKPAPRGRWNSLKGGNEDVSASKAVKIMSRIRTLIDETLKSEYAPFVSKAERKILAEESKMLKRYSDKAVIHGANNKIVYPTVAQREVFRKLQKEIEEFEPRFRKDSRTAPATSRGKIESEVESEVVDTAQAEKKSEFDTKPENKVEAQNQPKTEASPETETKPEVKG
ncbi:hypothetical protein N7532_000533 [Penicillium argentinense]|uniref:Pentatricopeptide repeat protein n=1 Tax=Penicillium argentinense TaxID=1131581 RepID=A0A9W9G5X1_9EURO|nr:uncharacterized protein N7532_000533 [Penicillium argentinense]KAJ5112488.1 hypothetical protein N7532_000533 [Penicillium argentinense]